MFAHRQPREVYRVYGEEEFFSEDQPQFDEDPRPTAATTVHGPSDELRAHESAHAGPDIFEEYDTVARGTPIEQAQAPLGEPWAAAGRSPADTGQEAYESRRAFSPPIATQLGSRRRAVAVAALAAALGLLFGLIAVRSLSPGHSQAQVPSQTSPSQAHISTVTAAHAKITPRSEAPRDRSHARSPRHSARPVDPPRSTHTHVESAARVHRARPAATAPISAAFQPRPEIPVSAPTPTYAPPSSSDGMEFGFEH